MLGKMAKKEEKKLREKQGWKCHNPEIFPLHRSKSRGAALWKEKTIVGPTTEIIFPGNIVLTDFITS